MTTSKAFRLENLKIHRVALVDLGAGVDKKTGDGPRILLAKRQPAPAAVALPDAAYLVVRKGGNALPWRGPEGISLPLLLAGARAVPTLTPVALRKRAAAALEVAVLEAAPLVERAVLTDVAKLGAVTFDEAQARTELEAARGELHTKVWSLYDALCSITSDGELEDKAGAMRTSLGQFVDSVEETITDYIGDVAGGAAAGEGDDITKVAALRAVVTRLRPLAKEATMAVKKADLTKAPAHIVALLKGLGITEPTEEQLAAAVAAVPEVKAAAVPPAPAGPTLDDVLKKLSPEEAAVVKAATPAADPEREALRKRVDEAEAIAKGERAQRLRGERIAKATRLKHAGFTGDDDHDIIAEIEDKCSAPIADRLMKKLQAAATALEKSALFTAVGSELGGADSSDPLAKATAIAQEKIAKGDKRSLEAVRADVWKDNPALLRDYNDQQNEGR